jgi:hypothetical protein
MPASEEGPEIDIFFSPTKHYSAFERRWDTKSAPEVTELITKVTQKTGCSYSIMTDRPLQDVLKAKRRSRIVIDDLTTGSYHLTGLEGLAQGKPVLNFLDARSLQLISVFSGARHCPFINVRLEDAEETLLWLLEHPDECAEIGNAGREWLLSFWNEEMLIKHFEQAYIELLDNSSALTRQDDVLPETGCRDFHYRILPDIIFEARKNRSRQMHG